MKLTTDIFSQFDQVWALVTAGTPDNFNTMTISWGGLGTIWGKPVATVYIRTSRYTHEFVDANDYFTISFYPEEYKSTGHSGLQIRQGYGQDARLRADPQISRQRHHL